MENLKTLQEEGIRVKDFIIKDDGYRLMVYTKDFFEGGFAEYKYDDMGYLFPDYIAEIFKLGQISGIEKCEDMTKKLNSHRFTGMYAEFARQGYDTCVNEILFNINKLKQELK